MSHLQDMTQLSKHHIITCVHCLCVACCYSVEISVRLSVDPKRMFTPVLTLGMLAINYHHGTGHLDRGTRTRRRSSSLYEYFLFSPKSNRISRHAQCEEDKQTPFQFVLRLRYSYVFFDQVVSHPVSPKFMGWTTSTVIYMWSISWIIVQIQSGEAESKSRIYIWYTERVFHFDRLFDRRINHLTQMRAPGSLFRVWRAYSINLPGSTATSLPSLWPTDSVTHCLPKLKTSCAYCTVS